jgi:hypothetical protein
LDPLDTAAINRPIVPAPGDYYYGEIGGMIGSGNRSTRRKPAPVPSSEFALGSRKTTDDLDRIDQLQDIPGTNWLMASGSSE